MAIDTHILIRPAARGGKYLGPDAARPISSTEQVSAMVVLTDDDTGQVVACKWVNTHGKEAGPANLMDPVRRSAPFATDGGTIGVTFTVSIEKPTTYRVRVLGPLSHAGQGRQAEAFITVLPGVNIGGPSVDALALTPEGVVIEVPGLCISDVQSQLQGPTLQCSATVTMMCGCKIGQRDTPNPGSTYPWPWPHTDFKVELVTVMAGGARYIYPLAYVPDPQKHPTSRFSGQWPNQANSPNDPIVQAWVSASQPSLGNQGFYQIFPFFTPALLPPELEALVGKLE